MGIEIERKFLLAIPVTSWGVDRLASSAAEVTQGYLTEPSDRIEVRVRRARPLQVDAEGVIRDESSSTDGTDIIQWLAVKADIPTAEEGGFSRHELEVQITTTEFEQAWRLVGRRVLHKVRNSVAVRDHKGSLYEVTVDEFRGRLEGLHLAEIEFESWEASVMFKPPGFLGEEVTHDKRYRNSYLADVDVPPYP